MTHLQNLIIIYLTTSKGYGGNMDSFKHQIEQDIREYQENLKFVANIDKDEWSFNYWVLDKLFYEEEEHNEEKIIY